MARGPAGWQEHYASSRSAPAVPNEWITSRSDGAAPGRALDVACGAGRHAVRLAEQGWHVTAVDFSPAAIERTRAAARAAGVSIDARVGDCSGPSALMPGPAGSRGYDLIIIAFFHDVSLLSSLDELLAPGGRVLVVTHAPSSRRGPADPALRPAAREVAAALPGGLTVTVCEESARGYDDGVNRGSRHGVLDGVAHVHVEAIAPAR